MQAKINDGKDLRGFLQQLQVTNPRDFVRVTKPVSPNQEPTALLRRLEMQAQWPVVWFERVGDHSIPLVMNVHATRERLALALGVTPGELNATYQKRLQHPIEPTLVETGPVKEVVQTGDQVDLRELPILIPSANTTAP